MLHRCQSIYSGFLRTCIAANLLSRLHLTNEEQTCQHEFALSGRGIRSQRTVAVWSRWVCSRPKSEFRTCTRRLSSWRHTASRSPFATVHRPGQIKILSMPSQIGAEREVRVRGKKKPGPRSRSRHASWLVARINSCKAAGFAGRTAEGGCPHINLSLTRFFVAVSSNPATGSGRSTSASR